jgi:hypothetical protein
VDQQRGTSISTILSEVIGRDLTGSRVGGTRLISSTIR